MSLIDYKLQKQMFILIFFQQTAIRLDDAACNLTKCKWRVAIASAKVVMTTLLLARGVVDGGGGDDERRRRRT